MSSAVSIESHVPRVRLVHTLLRARGVRPTNAQLLALAEESSFHALTLDLLGGYVAAFCDGDPARLPPLAEVKVPDEAAAEDSCYRLGMPRTHIASRQVGHVGGRESCRIAVKAALFFN